MKKQYTTPVCESLDIDIQAIIATSPVISDNGYSDTSEEGLAKERVSDFDYSYDDFNESF